EAQRAALAERMAQIARDVERERGLAADAAAAIARLDAERAELEAGRSAEVDTRTQLKAALDHATTAAEAAEAEYSGLSQRMAADEARKVALDRRIAELTARRSRLTNELVGAGEQRARVQADLASPGDQVGDPIIDQMTIGTGYEIALGAALGDDLGAPQANGETAAMRWDSLPDYQVPQPLPPGAVALTHFISAAPAALGRRL